MSGWVKVFDLDNGWQMGVWQVHEPLASIRFLGRDSEGFPYQRFARIDLDKLMFIDATPVPVSPEKRAELVAEARAVQA